MAARALYLFWRREIRRLAAFLWSVPFAAVLLICLMATVRASAALALSLRARAASNSRRSVLTTRLRPRFLARRLAFCRIRFLAESE